MSGFLLLLLAGPVTEAQIDSSPMQREDAAAEREKILRAADQIEVLQHQFEASQAEVQNLQGEVSQLKTDVAALKEALEKSEASRAQERKVLLDEIGKMLASSKAKKSVPEKEETPKKEESSGETSSDGGPATSEKGYYHTVEHGETLSLIVQAYREKGVMVTVTQVRKANGMGPNDVLKTGQKLFIPKP